MKKSWSYISLTAVLFVIIASSCNKNENEPSNIVKDIDGNVYHTINIGTQVWMIENLKTSKFTNGDPIPNITNAKEWSDLTTGAYCDYLNSSGNSTTYGKLYNWYAVNDSRKIAPVGWHVATDAEWATLITYLGGESVAGGKMKETGTTHWKSPNTGATNGSGFLALPSGNRYDTGDFDDIGYSCKWWSSTESATDNSYHRYLNYNTSNASRDSFSKTGGASVRCVRDL